MSQKKYIQVWDLLVRIFHWSLVLFVLVTFLTGDEESLIHRYVGYAVLGLIIVRVVWGFIGSKYARFKNFIYPPATAIKYLKKLLQGSPQYYIGHNPAAGWMVLLLLALLFVVCGTGHLAYQPKDQSLSSHGDNSFVSIVKYARADSDDDDDDDDKNEHHEYYDKEENEFWEELHETASFTLLSLILLHICGALVSSKLHNENLVNAMITGKKGKRS